MLRNKKIVMVYGTARAGAPLFARLGETLRTLAFGASDYRKLTARRATMSSRPKGRLQQAMTILRNIGPYAAIELILPGGSLIVVLLWLYRRFRRMVLVKRSVATA